MGESESEDQDRDAAARLEFQVRERTIEEIAKLGFDSEGKTKIGADAGKLAKETIMVFVMEGLSRAAGTKFNRAIRT